jgi:hypothetical protein
MDAAEIINAAAAEKERLRPRIEVKGVERGRRNPHREIRVCEMKVPPGPMLPQGKTWYVHPSQVEAHKRLFPGARVTRELKKTMARPAHSVRGLDPKGHRTRQQIIDDAAKAGHNFNFSR